MLYTEEAVRANIRNREGKRVFFLKKEDTLTPGARDFLRRERIEILDAAEAKIETYSLLNGGQIHEKPEHMTHLRGNVLVSKCHPRIAFRGAVDALEADLMLCQLVTEEPVRGQVEQILTLARYLIRYDVMEEPVPEAPLCGLTQQQIRNRSHFPQEHYGQAHFMPAYTDGMAVLMLNRCRCSARNAELAAVRAFSDVEGNPTRVDILQAMNRISSMLYLLMIQEKARGAPLGRKYGQAGS